MGRPSKLTPERQLTICRYIETGVPPEAAASAAGVGPSTFYRWKQLGQGRKSGIYWEFLEAIKEAEQSSEAALVAQALDVGARDWKCYVTILERRFPQRWARRWLKLDEPVGGSGISVTFTRPAVDPDAKGDELVAVTDVGEKPGNGNGGK